MNKRQAEAIGRDITRHGLTVTGYQRWVSPNERGASWSVNAADTATGYTFTVNEPGQWYERQSQYGNIAATPGRPPLSPDGVRMTYHSIAMPDALWAWAERGDTRSANTRRAVDAVRLLSDEQWAWLNEYGTPAEVLAEAVQFKMDVERAEAQAEDLAPTYNGGRW